MILSTVPDMVAAGGSGIRPVSRFRAVILADLAMRGCAISFLTLARVASVSSFSSFLCCMSHCGIGEGGYTVSFGTVAKYAADSGRKEQRDKRRTRRGRMPVLWARCGWRCRVSRG